VRSNPETGITHHHWITAHFITGLEEMTIQQRKPGKNGPPVTAPGLSDRGSCVIDGEPNDNESIAVTRRGRA
jgi:hypothetical protein